MSTTLPIVLDPTYIVELELTATENLNVLIDASTSSTVVISPPADAVLVELQPILRGPAGPSGSFTTVSGAADVDITNLADGSVLVYSTTIEKWQATNTLEKQVLEAGQF